MSVCGDGQLRSALSCSAFVGVDGECEYCRQSVGRGDIDHVVGFGEMEVVGAGKSSRKAASCRPAKPKSATASASMACSKRQVSGTLRSMYRPAICRVMRSRSCTARANCFLLRCSPFDSMIRPFRLVFVLYKYTVLAAMKVGSRQSPCVYVRFRLWAVESFVGVRGD